jgi:hypothetical protein
MTDQERIKVLEDAIRAIGSFAFAHSGRDGHDVLLRALYRIGEECEALLASEQDF